MHRIIVASILLAGSSASAAAQESANRWGFLQTNSVNYLPIVLGLVVLVVLIWAAERFLRSREHRIRYTTLSPDAIPASRDAPMDNIHLAVVRAQLGAGSKPVFLLDAFVHVPPKELALLEKYRMMRETLYLGTDAERHSALAREHFASGSLTGALKGAYRSARARFSFKITVGSLTQRGVRIETKDISQLLQVEDALLKGLSLVRTYVAVAQSFDGRPDIYRVLPTGGIDKMERDGSTVPVNV